MAEVFLCGTGQLTDDSREALREAGIVVVEVADPSKCQFIRSTETVSGEDMLYAAAAALREAGDGTATGDRVAVRAREQFALSIMNLIEAAHHKRTAIEAGDSGAAAG